MNEQIEKALCNLFEELVPVVGKAESKAGEMVRAVNRIVYRYYNDGDQIGIEYGKETCNAPARFLSRYGSEDVVYAIEKLWECYDYGKYEKYLDELGAAVIVQLTAQPELRSDDTEDMLDLYDPDEDNCWDDEEEDIGAFWEDELVYEED